MGDEFSTKNPFTQDFITSTRLGEIIDNFASVCELYSVVLDINGKTLVEPTGPKPYLGEFYEIINNPKYYGIYTDIVNCIVDSKQSMYSEIDDGNPDSRLSAAPIFLNGRFYATWLLYAQNKAQNQKLFKAFDKQAELAKILSDILSELHNGSRMNVEEESMRSQLQFEHQSKMVMEDILRVVAAGNRANIKTLYDKIGELLDVDYMVYYAFDADRPGYMKLIDYWAKNGKSDESESGFAWNSDHYDQSLQEMIKNGGLIIDKKNMTNQMRVEVFRGKARAIMVFPLYINGAYAGRVIFIENTKERIWTKQEINFAQEVTEMLSRDMTIEARLKAKADNERTILGLFDSIPVPVAVRSVKSGKILYVNSVLKEKIGRDITGEDSRILAPSVQEEFEGYGAEGTGGRSNIEYKRFIDQLSGIYDIKEAFVNWGKEGEVSVLVITEE